jgi:hypothetical protein
MTVTQSSKCKLTGADVDYTLSGKGMYYNITVAERKVDVFLCQSCYDRLPETSPQIMKGLIANKIWPDRAFVVTDDCNNSDPPPAHSEKIVLKNYLETTSFPRTPSEKLDNLFLNLYKLQEYDGSRFSINFSVEDFWVKNYFKNIEECLFYLKGLKESELIYYDGNAHEDSIFEVTHKGLNRAVQLLEDGNASSNCFVAMAFDESTKPFREAIRKAIRSTGFKETIIDEVHLASDKTIPDGILSGIKRSKFCISDFTMHRMGVYFESGYALGLGKPVIYTCNKTDFGESHFDIKQLQHIIYTTPEELEKMLVAKIEAWIK